MSLDRVVEHSWQFRRASRSVLTTTGHTSALLCFVRLLSSTINKLKKLRGRVKHAADWFTIFFSRVFFAGYDTTSATSMWHSSTTSFVSIACTRVIADGKFCNTWRVINNFASFNIFHQGGVLEYGMWTPAVVDVQSLRTTMSLSYVGH